MRIINILRRLRRGRTRTLRLWRHRRYGRPPLTGILPYHSLIPNQLSPLPLPLPPFPLPLTESRNAPLLLPRRQEEFSFLSFGFGIGVILDCGIGHTNTYEYTSFETPNAPPSGFWDILARKAKSIIEDDNAAKQSDSPGQSSSRKFDTSTDDQYRDFHQSYQPSEGHHKKHLDSLATSLYNIGGKMGNALEEGLSIVENRTADIIQETRKLNIGRKGGDYDMQSHGTDCTSQHNATQFQIKQETQLKASRDVANAMAAKSKLLLRELKTVKADLAFAKERCSQLEEENKVLRENRDKEEQIEDDDLVRLQLETLLAEKARLAHENSVYARENRFLREIVEYHQLTMQDVVYLDESNEEVTEVYPIQLPTQTSGRTSSPRILTPAVSFTQQQHAFSTLPSPRTPPPQVSITPFDVPSSAVHATTSGCCHEGLENKKAVVDL